MDQGPDDADLVARFSQGDGSTIEVVRRWFRSAATPYRARLGGELDDLEQQVLLDLTVALQKGRFDGRSSFRTYVRTFTHHQCIDRLRFAGRREWIDIADLELPDTAPSALDAIAREERTRIALAIVERMPESCRELWRMIHDGASYQEMSERLGLAPGTLRARVLRCRRRARALRNEYLSGKRNETEARTTR